MDAVGRVGRTLCLLRVSSSGYATEQLSVLRLLTSNPSSVRVVGLLRSSIAIHPFNGRFTGFF